MAVDPLTLSAVASAVNAATPFVSRALQGLFGVTSAEDEERKRIEAAMAPYLRVAQGGTTQGQAGLSYARGRAAQELQGQAARGTAQQQAGLQREAMRVGQDVNAQYASQLADLRAREQERALMGVARGQAALADVAKEEAARKRQELAGFVEGVGGMAARMLAPGEKPGGAPGKTAGATGRVSPLTAKRRAAREAAAAAPRVRMAGAKVTPVGRYAPVPEVDTLAALQQAQSRGAANAAAGIADYEPFAYGFTKQEMETPSLATGSGPARPSIYAMGGLDFDGPSLSKDMAPAPIAMTTSPFARLRPGHAPMPKLEPNNPVTPTRRRGIVSPKQRLRTIELGDDFIEQVDSPTYITGRMPENLRTR